MKEESPKERAERERLYMERTHQQFVEFLKLECSTNVEVLAGPTREFLQARIEECSLLYEKYSHMYDDCSPDWGQISVERAEQKAAFWKKEMEKAQEKLDQLRGEE